MFGISIGGRFEEEKRLQFIGYSYKFSDEYLDGVCSIGNAATWLPQSSRLPSVCLEAVLLQRALPDGAVIVLDTVYHDALNEFVTHFLAGFRHTYNSIWRGV